MKKLISLALALLVFPAALPAQAPAGDRWEGVRDLVRRTMEERGIPSVAVAVAQDGEIVWEEGFGWADRERRAPATSNTMYSLASISKPMTATGLMRLVERGRVDLDRPANDYLGGGKIHSRAWGPAGATVRRVLSHTAGLPLHYEFFYEGEGHPRRTTDEGIARYGILVNPPGEVYEYSNLGYGILDRIIERASGRDYADYMRDEVFLPLGMTRTAVGTGAGLTDAAVRYDSEGRPIPFYDFDHRGGSAVYASVRDLVRFGAFHLKDRAADQQPILSEETIDLMQRLATPAEPGYGLGWLISDDRGHRRVSHTGGMPGVATVLNLYPEAGLAVAVLTNTSDRVVNQIAQEVAAVALPGYAAALRAEAAREREDGRAASAPPPELLGRWTGTVRTYEGELPLALEFRPEGGAQVRLGDERAVPLEEVSYRDGALVGRFAGAVPTEDARHHPHSVLLELRLREGKLTGSATAQTTEAPIYFALSSFVELRRGGGPGEDRDGRGR